MKNNNDIGSVQNVVLDIYKEIKKICEENDVRFFAISGTAIGAVRHQGFIPWDDDIDLVMPRVDYNRFKKIANKKLPSHMRFLDFDDADGPHTIFGVVQNNLTTSTTRKDIDNGVFRAAYVDIMPIDGTPNNSIAYRIHRAHLSYINKMLGAVVHSSINDSAVKKIAQSVIRTLTSKKRLVARFEKVAMKYDFDNSIYLARFWSFSSHDGLQHLSRYYKDDFARYLEMPFEDTTIRVPAGYDRYLTALYPGYMTLPPEEKRVPRHSDGIIDLTHSYKYYAAKHEGKIIGYVPGSFDMFHVGHLNILKKAKKYCDYLIVGVNSDDLMYLNKKKKPVVPQQERVDIIRSIKIVDEVLLVDTPDKIKLHEIHGFDILFVGSDYKGRWDDLEKQLNEKKASVHYFDYTTHTSSTKLRSALDDILEKK